MRNIKITGNNSNKMRFERKQPCNNCPYRKDAPKAHWSIEEFKDLLRNDADHFGTTYGCHKKDDHVCVGWLMDQVKRNIPSIALRIALMKNKVSREYLNALRSPSKMFSSVREMCIANFKKLRANNKNLHENHPSH